MTTELDAVAFDAFGVGAVVRVGGPDLAARVRQRLPPGARPRGARSGDAEFAIDVAGDADYRVAIPGGEEVLRTAEVDEAVDRLGTELLEHVAAHAPEHVFVRAGAVAMGGRAILLPGGPAADTSPLVAALVRDGAIYYGDGYVPIDASGHLHPYPVRQLASDETGDEVGHTPAPVAIIATVTPGGATAVALRERPPDDGISTLLQHAHAAEGRPEFALRGVQAAAQQALVLEGERNDAEQAAAVLIERLARLPREGPQLQRPELPPAIEFVSLVLELEGELAELAGILDKAGVDAVLLNGDEVRPGLAHGFAFSFSAVIEIPHAQVPRALGTMESAGWQPISPQGGARYFRRGVVVKVLARRPKLGGAASDQRRLVRGRLGFAEPEVKVAEGEPEGAPLPMPLDPGGRLRTGWMGAALQVGAEALAGWDTLRLRTSERQFHELPLQYGPGVHAFETATESLADAVLARLPDVDGVRFVDVGTGTGAVALTVARQRPRAEVLGADVSLRALGWARRNRRRLGVRNVRFAQGSLLSPVPAHWRGEVAAVGANPPMSGPAFAVELRGVSAWPVGTATGPGADGLGLVRALARDARDVLAPGGHLHLHLLAPQAAWIAKHLDELGYEADIPPDASNQPSTVEIAARWPGHMPR